MTEKYEQYKKQIQNLVQEKIKTIETVIDSFPIMKDFRMEGVITPKLEKEIIFYVNAKIAQKTLDPTLPIEYHI